MALSISVEGPPDGGGGREGEGGKAAGNKEE